VNHTNGQPFSVETVKANLAVLTTAGFDTTAMTLMYVWDKCEDGLHDTPCLL
jgi:cytochrome P450